MTLTGLLPVLTEDPAVTTLLGLADPAATDTGAVDVVCAEGVRAPLLAALAARRPLLVVTATAREADDTVAGLRSFLPDTDVVGFPAWETLPHERLSPRSDTVAERLQVLRRLGHPDDGPDGAITVLVAPVRSVMQPFAVGLGDLRETRLCAGDEVDLDQVVRDLADAAYHRVDMVERRGEFAVRGGIVDVFPPTAAHPVRVEFFGDTVDELREFGVADQRSLATVEELVAPPCRELLLTDAVRERAAALLPTYPGAAELLTKVAEGSAVEGMEAFIPVLVDSMTTLLDVVPVDTLVVSVDPTRVDSRAQDLLDTGAEFLEAAWSNAAAGNVTPVDLSPARGLGDAPTSDGLSAGMFRTLADLQDHAGDLGLDWWTAGSLAADAELRDVTAARLVTVPGREVQGYRGDLSEAATDLGAHVRDGWRLVVVTEGHGPAQHLVTVLGSNDVPARYVDSLDVAPEPGVVHVTTAGVLHGFVSEPLRLALLTETDLAGQRTSTKDMRKMPSKRRQMVDPLTLKPGDHVVHETHGIGRFVEMTQRVVQGATREYLVLEYAPSKRNQPGDRVYVPTDALALVSRYVGGEAPALSKMGGSDWQKAKGRARKAVKQIAGELIQLYSARMASIGHAFGKDTVWQRELEDAFPYAETPDQLASIDEVKADMERAVPMDRLICGDVGYGKTEIALRAAFKAVMDGKQVAVLVPTTLLVQQHLSTFSERFAGYPVVVRALSRFSSDAEAKTAREGVAEGSVDVVIGTHRLLSKDMRFKDLGLVVIDEEQRFGVEHKEQLKKLRTNVDVLAMSATPIPRTLEMAVTGIREMSTLATPPEERHPILTYVGPYDERQVGAAIRRELLREGQVFFVHNRVSDIDRVAAHLGSLVPEARIRVAHGQMGESDLEQTVVDFWERRFDVLVCTTIVETGLDIANANTLILDRADTFGLSQLHQLRGRVGRGRERAYAYFMWNPGATLTDTAHDRLATIAANTELGAGMQVAMKDLEIRGAGNLLGGEQSGHIEGVGFDLYLRMVAEAVTDYRRDLDGDTEPPPVDTTLDLPVDAYLPHDYVPAERLRLDAYRRLASAVDDAELDAVAEDLRDRFGAGPDGTLPAPVQALFAVARLRVFLRGYGLADVSVQGKFLRLAPVVLPESAQLRLGRLHPKSVVKPSLSTVLVPLPTAPQVGRLSGGPVTGTDLIAWVRELVAAVLPAPAHPSPPSTGPRPESTTRADPSSPAGATGATGPVSAVGFRTEHESRTVERISRR